MKKLYQIVAVSMFALFVVSCSEPEPTLSYQEGVHFEVFTAVEASSKPKQQLTEFFWYGCSHCQAFAPVLKQWLVNKQSLTVDYMPIIWNEKTELHAKVFFLIKAQPDFETLHANMFDFIAGFDRTSTVGEQKVALIKQLNEWGIQPIAAADAIEGEVYTAELANVLQQMKSYAISGVPTVIVNGQYKVVNKALKNTDDILSVVDYLLSQE